MVDYTLLRKAFGQKILGGNSLLEEELANEFSIIMPAQERTYLHPGQQESSSNQQPIIYQCKIRGVDIGDTRNIGFEIASSLAELRAYREALAERREPSLLDRAKSKVTEWLTGLSSKDIERLKRK